MSAPWPKRPDGTNKTMGEMTPEEQREQWRAAGKRLEAEFKRPEVQAGFAAAFAIAEASTGRCPICGSRNCQAPNCGER